MGVFADMVLNSLSSIRCCCPFNRAGPKDLEDQAPTAGKGRLPAPYAIHEAEVRGGIRTAGSASDQGGRHGGL